MLSIVSCEGFLDRPPLDQIDSSQFYQTANDARLAMLSVYAPMQSVNWYGKSWMLTEIPTDNTEPGGNDPDFSPIDNFTVNPDNVPNAEFWAEHFKTIALANQVISNVPPIQMDLNEKNSIIGEARFMRAFAYFDLVRIYGGVPIIEEVPTISSDLNVFRNSVDEVYVFIIQDLLYAYENTKVAHSGADLGRATSGSAGALLAKVYLTNEQYNNAIELSNEIINTGRYKLQDDFDDNWLKEKADNNQESIFQVQYAGCGPVGTGNALQAFFAPWGEGITGNSDGWGSQVPSGPQVNNPGSTIKDAFEEHDLRLHQTIMTSGDFYPEINADKGGYTYPATGASKTSINIKKYVIGGGPDVCFMTTPMNVHVIRYADVLLTLAEASCGLSGGLSVNEEAIEAFNQIRRRAGIDEVSLLTSELVLEERRREFAFENQRWFDLLRSGKVKEIMTLHGKLMQDHHVLFPIPSEEISINPNLEQNPGYN